jgi:hypothetical protein
MSDDDVRAGEELAKAWLAGKSGLSDDLALLVSGLSQPLDATARTFLSTIGSDARAMAKREARPTPSARRTPTPMSAQPTPEPPVAPTISLDEMIRRIRERERAARLEELGRRNQEAWLEQGAMIDAARRF